MTLEIDIAAKRQELIELWQDLFAVCRDLVDSVKAGKAVLRASTIRELNMFLRESASILANLEELERKQKVESAYAEAYSEDAPKEELPFPVSPDTSADTSAQSEPLRVEED